MPEPKPIIHKESAMGHASFRTANRPLRACLLLASVLGVAFLTPAIFAAAPPAPTVDIGIAKFAYGPKDITITPGTKIVWTNHDDTPHTVTSNDKSFASKGLDTDDKFEHIFASEGDFSYICTVHPFMTGVVHVHRQ
jgi:plastocyanin